MSLPPFQLLLDAHGGDVLRVLVASLGWHDGQDCYQETFIAALRAYPGVTDPSQRGLRAWILTIAHNKAIDAHRARNRRPVPAGDAFSGDRFPVDGLPFGGLAADGPAADGLAADGLVADGLGSDIPGDVEPALWAEVRRLPPKQRMAVVHRFVGDLPYAAIGEVMGCSEAAARRSVHEGLKKLREAR